jgi:hypothetical protein
MAKDKRERITQRPAPSGEVEQYAIRQQRLDQRRAKIKKQMADFASWVEAEAKAAARTSSNPEEPDFTQLGPKVRLAAETVLALWREGFRWGDRETLLKKVRERSGDKGLSLRTLDAALQHLRGRGLITY